MNEQQQQQLAALWMEVEEAQKRCRSRILSEGDVDGHFEESLRTLMVLNEFVQFPTSILDMELLGDLVRRTTVFSDGGAVNNSYANRAESTQLLTRFVRSVDSGAVEMRFSVERRNARSVAYGDNGFCELVRIESYPGLGPRLRSLGIDFNGRGRYLNLPDEGLATLPEELEAAKAEAEAEVAAKKAAERVAINSFQQETFDGLFEGGF